MSRKPIVKKLVQKLQPKRTVRAAKASFMAGTKGRLGKFADLNVDVDVGDIVLGGRFKNKRIKVKKLGTDKIGQPSLNGRPLLNYRIEKKLPENMKSSKTREMAKKAYHFGFQDELKRIAG